MAKTVKITQTGSHIGRTDDQRATLIGLGLNILIIKLFTDFLGLWYGWGAFVAVGAVALNNFLLNNAWTFTHKTSDMP